MSRSCRSPSGIVTTCQDKRDQIRADCSNISHVSRYEEKERERERERDLSICLPARLSIATTPTITTATATAGIGTGTGAGTGTGTDTGPDTGNVRDVNQVTATTTINSFKDILPRPTPPSPTSIINTTPATEKAEKEHDNTDWDEDEEEEEEEEEKALLGTFTEPYPLIIADTCLLHDVLPKIA